ncbi:MAG: TolC family protein [Xanthobacteraceae bacterium]|nr:TolC family protein [Xanthobacteraceae bacterium]
MTSSACRVSGRRFAEFRLAAVPLILALSGCAGFSPDAGLSAVAEMTAPSIRSDVVFIRSDEEAARAGAAVRRLLGAPLGAGSAVAIALLNNSGLQASYNDLALAETDLVAASLPPNPVFAVSRIAGDGASEIERQVVGDILALATLPFRSEIARDRFRQAQLRAALDTLRLASEVRRAYYRTVAAGRRAALLADAQGTAAALAQLAGKLGDTGAISKLDLAREQVFAAEMVAELAAARQDAASGRERLARLLGLSGADLGFRLSDRLPPLPRRPPALATVEVDAIGHRIDLQIARIELEALAKSLDLTEATRFVTMLELAGLDRRTVEPQTSPFRERGFDIAFQIPVFDGGEVRLRQAAETYRRAFNRLTDKAVNVRSEARDAYRVYRSSYDIARQYQREVLPLRSVIMQEMQLRLSSMQVDVFALVTEERQRIASQRAAIDALRDFWLAQSDLDDAVNGGGAADRRDDGRVAVARAADADR